MLQRVWREGNLPTLSVRMQTGTNLWRTVWRFLTKLKIELLYDPTIPLLGMYTEIYAPMFTAALFTIAGTWWQPKCPSTREWIKKTVVHIYNGILPSHKKE